MYGFNSNIELSDKFTYCTNSLQETLKLVVDSGKEVRSTR